LRQPPFTDNPQYTGLQKLHEKYQDRGLVVLGFPSNQFGAQEPGSDQDIAEVRPYWIVQSNQ
jgi:glutathione peroxidase-family protein